MIADTLSDFFKQTARKDRGCLFVDSSSQEQWIAYSELYYQANEIADKLRSSPLRRRFIAVIWMHQSPDCFKAFMAVVLAGGIPVPLHPTSRFEETLAIVEKVEAEVLMLSTSHYAKIDRSISRQVHLVDGDTGETIGEKFSSNASKDSIQRRYTPPEKTAVIFMSSGSTGTPKGIMLSDKNLLSNVHSIQGYLELTENDYVLITKSFGYSSTITGEWLLALLIGAHLQMTSGFFHPLHTVKFIRDYKTTFMCTVPSVLLPLIQSNKWKSEDLLSLNKLIIVGGQMPANMLIQLQERLPRTQIMPCYGLTEASPRVSFLPSHDLMKKASSIGFPIPGVHVGIYQDGKQNDHGTIGEIIVSGPNVMLGYYDDPQRSAMVLSSVGLRTSDMGYMDEEGYIYITGRLDNAINVAGHTLYPETMEQIILNHPMVREVAVAGMTSEIWGQVPVAFIVPNDNLMTEKDLIDELFIYCQEHLTAVQRPKEMILVQTLPKRENGKLDRKNLQSIVKEKSYAT